LKHVRGEKVVFGKGDYLHLDGMPSAAHEHANVLATPRARSWIRAGVKFATLVVLIVVIGIGSLFIALERGYLDETLTVRAEDAMSAALGDQFKPEVGSVRLCFSQNWMLALAAVDVKLTHVKTGIVALKTDSITAVLDPISALQGKVTLARAEIGKAEGDLRFLPPSAPIDWKMIRIDSVPQVLAQIYPALDRGVAALANSKSEEIAAESISLQLPQSTPLGDKISLSDLNLSRPGQGRYVLTTAIRYGKLDPKLTVSLDSVDGA